jgi:hypothetical protein
VLLDEVPGLRLYPIYGAPYAVFTALSQGDHHMHAVLRRYTVRLGTVDAAARYAEETLLPLVRQVPGFSVYYLVDAGRGTMMSVALFETAEGAERANDLISRWFRNDWPTFRAVPPEMTTGRVLAHAATNRTSVSMSDEGFVDRRTAERRATDRRMGDRRIVPEPARVLSAG